MKDIKTILEEILKMINKGEVFLSEVDFQFNLARCLEQIEEISNVILEYPMQSKEIYNQNSEYFVNKNTKKDMSYIDIYFKYNEEEYYIELKYKTAKCTVKRHGNEFILKPQGANNIGRYLIYEDIERLEHIVNKNPNRHGFVIVITNDCAYWKSHSGNSENFVLEASEKNKNTNNTCNFFTTKEQCNKCSKNTCSNDDKHYLGFLANDQKNRKRPLKIENQYPLKWKDWEPKDKKPKPEFKYLIIEIPNQKK